MLGNKRKKQEKKLSNAVICLSAIAALNLIGISHAAWNDRILIHTTISTGNIAPYFETGNNASNPISVHKISDHALHIRGECDWGHSETIAISIPNSGSIPVTLKNVRRVSSDSLTSVQDIQNDAITLVIDAAKVDAETSQTHTFEYRLSFEQAIR